MAVLKAAAVGKIFNILDKKISSHYIIEYTCMWKNGLTLVSTEYLIFVKRVSLDTRMSAMYTGQSPGAMTDWMQSLQIAFHSYTVYVELSRVHFRNQKNPLNVASVRD